MLGSVIWERKEFITKMSGAVAAGRQGSWKGKLKAHIFNHKQKAERERKVEYG